MVRDNELLVNQMYDELEISTYLGLYFDHCSILQFLIYTLNWYLSVDLQHLRLRIKVRLLLDKKKQIR